MNGWGKSCENIIWNPRIQKMQIIDNREESMQMVAPKESLLISNKQ